MVYGIYEQKFHFRELRHTAIASAIVLASGVDHCRGDDEEHRVPKENFKLTWVCLVDRDSPKSLPLVLNTMSHFHRYHVPTTLK